MKAWRNAQNNAKKFIRELSKHRSLIVFDTETTGTGTDAKVIQFSGQRYEITKDLELIEAKDDFLDLYIKPVDEYGVQEPLKPKITEITGITDETLSYAEPEQYRMGLISDFLNTASVWVAYNAGFDLRMLEQMENRLGKKFRMTETLDALIMARDCLPDLEKFNLSEVVKVTHPEEAFGFHDSLEDVKATGKVLAYCIDHYKKILAKSEEGKEIPKLKYAFFNENPYKPSQKRIKVALVGEEDYAKRNNKQVDQGIGRIYWDITYKRWCCKKEKKAEELFDRIDLGSLERQILQRYSKNFDYCDTMDQLGAAWAKQEAKLKSEKKAKEKATKEEKSEHVEKIIKDLTKNKQERAS